MTFFLLVLLLVGVIIYIFWILLKPVEKHPAKKGPRKKIDPKNKNTEVRQENQNSNIDPIRKKIAEQIKKDPEIISRALSYWLNQK